MADVFDEISALLDTEDGLVQTAIDIENQRHEDALAALDRRKADLAQVRATLGQLEQQAEEPTPPADDAPASPPPAGDAAVTAPDGSEAAASVTPDPQEAAAVPEAPADDAATIVVTSASTGQAAVVAVADVAVASDPTVPDEALTEPQAILRNSDFR